MKILINERLSKHRCKTPEGYLICTDAILARTGKQTYRKNEIFKDSDDETEIEVDRTEDEVFSPQTLASFENKPVTVEHPDEDVNVHNYKEYAVGFVRDVRRGEVDGQPVILGNLVITDEQTIQEIENGEHTDLSCGYDCDIADEPNPCQRNIRGNHVALCECGRAGIARIVDSKCKDGIIKTVSLRGSIQRGDIGKIQFNLIKENSCWISIEGLYQDDKSGLINISGRSECVLVKKNGGLTVNVQYVVEKLKSRSFEKIEHRIETSTDFWKDDVIDFVEKTYDRVLNSVKTKDSMKDTRMKVANLTNGYAIVPASRWRKFGLNSEVERFTTNLDEARYIRSSLERNDGISFVIVDVTQRRTTDSMKDAEQTFRVLAVVPGDYDDEPGFDIIFNVKANSENEAIAKAKKYAEKTPAYRFAWDFRIAKPNQHTRIERNVDSMKDAFIPDAQATLYAVKAKYENVVLEWYVRANSEREAFDKVKRQPGHNFDTFVSAKIVKERAGMHIIDESAVYDTLIPPTKEAINKFETLLRIFDIKIDRKGLTPLGRVHYQVRASMEFDRFVKRLERIDDEMDKLGIPMTFNAGSDGNTCTAGIDLDKQCIKDAIHDSIKEDVARILKPLGLTYTTENVLFAWDDVLIRGFEFNNKKDAKLAFDTLQSELHGKYKRRLVQNTIQFSESYNVRLKEKILSDIKSAGGKDVKLFGSEFGDNEVNISIEVSNTDDIADIANKLSKIKNYRKVEQKKVFGGKIIISAIYNYADFYKFIHDSTKFRKCRNR